MIPLTSIDRTNTAFKISFPEKLPHALYTSIKQIGILNPVILRSLPQSSFFQIISGFRRINAVHRLGLTNIPATVHSFKELSDRDAFIIVVYDAIAGRELNIIEQAILLDKLSQPNIFSDDDVIRDFLPLLKIDANRFMFERMIKLLAVPPAGQTALAEGRLSIAAGELLLHFPPAERPPIVSLLNKLSIGKNKAELLIHLLFDITKRDQCRVNKILGEQILKDILLNKDFAPADKYHHIKTYLYNRRYPRLAQIQADIAKTINKLNLPHGIILTPPPSLEGSALKLECKIQQKKDISSCISILKKLIKNPSLQHLLKKI